MTCAAVFVAAVLYAVRTWRREGPLDAERLVRAVLLLVIGAGVFLPALAGLVNLSSLTLARLVAPEAAVARGDLLLTTLVAAALVLAARHWPARLGEGAFVALALAGATAVKLAYVLLIEVEPVSDFAKMWELTSSITEHGLDAARSSLAAYHTWSHFERVLPYLLPLRIAFGPEPESYAAANVVLEALTSLLVYRMTRPWFGVRAARIALVVSLAAVETVLAAEIPTHDLPGAFFTVLALGLVLTVWRLHAEGRLRAALLAGAGLGLAVLVLDLQRATGSMVLLSSALLGLAMAFARKAGNRAGNRRFLAVVGLALLPWAVTATGSWALRKAALRVPSSIQENALGLGLAAGTDSWGDGSYGYITANYAVPYSKLPVKWSSLALAKLATDTHHHPGARVASYLRKAKSLFDLGSQTYFYLHAGELRGLGPVDAARKARVLAISRCFSALFLGALAMACLRLWKTPGVPLPSLLPLLYLAVLASTLLFLAEVQPRYLYPIWYLGAVYTGALFGGSLTHDDPVQ